MLKTKHLQFTWKKAIIKWSDGQPLTIDDYIFTYEAISRPDYEGVRFSEDILNVEGVEEFHEGKHHQFQV